MDYSYLERNVADIRNRIGKAAAEAGRCSDDITLLAAVKYTDVDSVNYLHTHCGVNDIGENRVQQLLERWDKLEKGGLNVHFIGSLQTNKVKYIVDKVCMIHSVDSVHLAAEIEKQCAKIDRQMDALVEVNCGREENKTGVMPEDAEELCRKIMEFPHLRLRGFMTMAPKCTDKTQYEKYFTQTYDLVVDIWTKKLYNKERPVISMGMSGSFETAVKCGSTCVRIGNALFTH